ncbi:MAG: hypothetical protein H6R05_1207 [Burkholderiaceae bacterium]|nr:hypothetical protein [Burkholderiaceae bacterium]
MPADNETTNFSQDYELDRRLRHNGFRGTVGNREALRQLKKEKYGSTVLTHAQTDALINAHAKEFEKES